MAAVLPSTFDSHHTDMIHDAQLDYYGNNLATCSSDTTAAIFNSTHTLIQRLHAHAGPVWQVAWSHPKYGNLLATCSYDTTVIVWKEMSVGKWAQIYHHKVHSASVNSIAWAPHEYGLMLACASSDGKISVLSVKEEGIWESSIFTSHSIGANSVSWAPPPPLSSLTTATTTSTTPPPMEKRLVTAGCDNLVKIWKFDTPSLSWKEESVLSGHADWVRDVAWAPSIGLSKNYIASCSQDKSVIVWTRTEGEDWVKGELKGDSFGDVVWRVSWSPSGNILAVSCGDNKVSLWKEAAEGGWMQVGDVSDVN